MPGIILGALAGAGKGANDWAQEEQRSSDAQNLAQMQSDLALQKEKALADYQNNMNLTNQANERARLASYSNADPAASAPNDSSASTAQPGSASVGATAAAPTPSAADSPAGAAASPPSSSNTTTLGDSAKILADLRLSQQKALKNGDVAAAEHFGAMAEQQQKMTIEQATAAINSAESAAKIKLTNKQLSVAGLQLDKDQFGNPMLVDMSTGKTTMLGKNPMSSNGSAPDGSALPTGDAYLKTLDPKIAQQVKAIAEGRMEIPKGFALKSPYWQQIMSAVYQYDPSADAISLPSRAGTRKAFTSGKEAQSVNALNTVIGHLSALSDAADALSNTSIPAYNSVANYLASNTGDPRVKTFEATKKAVTDELTRAWRGSGGSEGDIKTWSSTLGSSSSPEQLHGVISQLGDLLESKIESLNDQYRKGMGTPEGGLQLLSPESAKTLEKIRNRSGASSSDSIPAAIPAQSTNTPQSADYSHLWN